MYDTTVGLFYRAFNTERPSVMLDTKLLVLLDSSYFGVLSAGQCNPSLASLCKLTNMSLLLCRLHFLPFGVLYRVKRAC